MGVYERDGGWRERGRWVVWGWRERVCVRQRTGRRVPSRTMRSGRRFSAR